MSKLMCPATPGAPRDRAIAVASTATGHLSSPEKRFSSDATSEFVLPASNYLQLDNDDGIQTVTAVGAGASQNAGQALDQENLMTQDETSFGTLATTLDIAFGANTRRQYGGFDLGYTGGGTLAVVQGDTAGVFAVVGGRLVLAGTAGAAPPVLASSYTLQISDGAGWAVTANVTRVDNARHVATVAELAAHGAALGETIKLRNNAFVFGSSTDGKRIAGPSGAFTGANWCIVEPDMPLQASITNVWCNVGGFKFRNMVFNGGGAGMEALRIGGANYFIDSCYFNAPGTWGLFSNQSINNVTVQDSTFYDVQDAISLGSDGGTATGFTALRNVFAKRYQDAVQLLNYGSVLVQDNLSIDKSGGAASQAHPDFVQLFNRTAAAGPVSLGTCVVRGNVVIRGNGQDGGYAGDHGVFMSMHSGGPYYDEITVENNFFQSTNANAINLSTSVVDATVRNNTAVYDPSAPDLIGVGSGKDSYPCIKVTATGTVIVTKNIVAGTVTASGNAVTNANNLTGQQSFASHQAIFANPYTNGSGNSGIAATDYAARKADFVARYATIGAGAGLGAFAPIATMTPYFLVDAYDSLTNHAASNGAAISLVPPLVLGTNSIQLDMRGAVNPSLNTTTFPDTSDPATWDLIGFCVDPGTDLFNSTQTAANPKFYMPNNAFYAHAVDTTYGNNPDTDFYPTTRGKRWLTFKTDRMRLGGAWAGAPMTTTGSGSKKLVVQVTNQNSNRNHSLKFGPFIRPQRIKPAIVWTFDDVNVGQFTKAAPAMQAAANAAGMLHPFVGTGMMCLGGLDTSTKLTSAQAMVLKNNYGWTWSLDSANDDQAFTQFPSRAAAIAQLNQLRDNCIALGYSTVEDAKMFCYSYGGHTYGQPGPLSLTPNGTDTIGNVTNGILANGYAAGMVVKGTGAVGNPILLAVNRTSISRIEFKFDRPIPASAARSFYFCATRRGLTYAATGNAQITVDTTYLVPGMGMDAYGVPSGLVITSVDVEGVSGMITMSGNVPSGTGVANFHLKHGEFAPGLMEDALLEAGYSFGRWGSAGGGNGIYTGYGLDPLIAIRQPAASIDDGTAVGGNANVVEKCKNEIIEATDNGRDLICYMHYGPQQNDDNFVLLAQWAAARCAAGDFDIISLRDWKARVDSRLPIA
ncbi:right-handed parallel beta-helix repeat-containing protein [Sphingomonas sp. TDK1]|uniref:right-handed parallel beta-helix repeat-containing protein n=1 Tax=Sphingomonas sp. TDK1 TaxID=453247 RepID=UPI0007DA46F0|nr:right-handed parallel beta-helix repeat-containing protein [Sphingomonas sp. TDK1]OAN59938.1 hypothetical protein A7X12_02255 [Sphingomonas sp. TDK1]